MRDSQGQLIPVGGDGEVLGSGELRIDVTKIGGAWLDVVPFVDVGNVTPAFSDLAIGNMNVATGLSLEYTTPRNSQPIVLSFSDVAGSGSSVLEP